MNISRKLIKHIAFGLCVCSLSTFTGCSNTDSVMLTTMSKNEVEERLDNSTFMSKVSKKEAIRIIKEADYTAAQLNTRLTTRNDEDLHSVATYLTYSENIIEVKQVTTTMKDITDKKERFEETITGYYFRDTDKFFETYGSDYVQSDKLQNIEIVLPLDFANISEDWFSDITMTVSEDDPYFLAKVKPEYCTTILENVKDLDTEFDVYLGAEIVFNNDKPRLYELKMIVFPVNEDTALLRTFSTEVHPSVYKKDYPKNILELNK